MTRMHEGTARKILVTVVLLPVIGLGVAKGVANSAAQGAAAEVAYVEAVSGRVIASYEGKPSLLDVLDVISDPTRLDLQANSELRVCHYRTRKILSLRGPLRVSISASNVTTENGKAVGATAETCAAPMVSTFQGGIVSRNIAVTTTQTQVPLRPSIKIINRGSKTIRKIVLWNGTRQTIVAAFERNVARPMLDDGQSYLLVVELNDGSEMKMTLQASAQTQTGPLFFMVR